MSDGPFAGKAFKGGFGIVTLILGIVFYVIAYFLLDIPEDQIIKEILLKIGDVLVIGVVLGYLTTVTQNLGVFKKELEDIIYTDKFVSMRSDIHSIWEKVSKQLFKSKFKHISGDLLKLIKNTYLPCDQISYYDDYTINIHIKWADKNKKLILVTNKISFDLIAEENTSIKFPLRSWINVEGLAPEDYHVKIDNYTVNNRPAKVVERIDRIDGNQHFFSETVELEGNLRYGIRKTIEKKYSLEKDFVIAFKAQYIVHDMIVRFTYPEDEFTIDFYTRGAVEDFIENDSKPGFIDMKYKGILLPKQGYIIALREKA